MASKVFLAQFGDAETEQSICQKTQVVFNESGLSDIVVPGEPTAVKTHFGEAGNDSFILPEFVKVVVDAVRSAGGDPCLVETSTLYRGQRHNAVDHFKVALAHGFGPKAMGCPLLFLDGLRGNRHTEQRVGLKHCDTVAVAADFAFLPSVVVVSHVTGHIIGGFAGAIKNVAMGLSSRAGKLRQHSESRPAIRAESCTSCGTCAEWCPEDAISVPEKAQIDYERCIGCGECAAVCPAGAVGISWDGAPETFNEKMAEYAFGILQGKQAGFISYVYRTTKDCNCLGEAGDSICSDLGVLASTDPVAVDAAAIDLVNESHGGDLFEEMWPGKHYLAQLLHAEAIGLGSRRYELAAV